MLLWLHFYFNSIELNVDMSMTDIKYIQKAIFKDFIEKSATQQLERIWDQNKDL